MSFLDSLQKGTNKTFTQNGAVTNKSSLDPVLDFFALAGSMRERPNDAVRLFEQAYLTDKQTALRCLFYLRDIRGGQGERTLFRLCMTTLEKLDRSVWEKVIKFVPEYGRWDDLFNMGSIDESLVPVIQDQLAEDEKNMNDEKPVSLLAKWMPSENTSSKATKGKAEKLAKLLKLKPSQYRRKVVALRKYIKLLEQKMSAGEWSAIEYDKIPSQAFRKHVKAFKRNDEKRYAEFLESVEKGEKKVNAQTLYTYEIFDTVQHDEAAANAMWMNLPNYVEHDALVVADVSGSMSGRPMSISVSLALYFAERNKGLMAGYFMTFADDPQLVKVTGRNLVERLRMIENAHWDGSTNMEAVFDTILKAAIDSGNKDIPKVIYIISDMEFNCVSNADESVFENAKRKFQEKDLVLPHVVFWNVDGKQNQTPATKFDNNVTLISGASQSTFRYAVEGKTPLESMNDILNSDRYAQITI